MPWMFCHRTSIWSQNIMTLSIWHSTCRSKIMIQAFRWLKCTRIPREKTIRKQINIPRVKCACSSEWFTQNALCEPRRYYLFRHIKHVEKQKTKKAKWWWRWHMTAILCNKTITSLSHAATHSWTKCSNTNHFSHKYIFFTIDENSQWQCTSRFCLGII